LFVESLKRVRPMIPVVLKALIPLIGEILCAQAEMVEKASVVIGDRRREDGINSGTDDIDCDKTFLPIPRMEGTVICQVQGPVLGCELENVF
jgi:hypothetical protein